MKRFPNGVDGQAFYQQRSRLEKPPPACGSKRCRRDRSDLEADARRFIGGSLITLLYMTQLAAISQDPGSRACSRRSTPTTSRIDLDPATARRSRACSTSRAGSTTSSTRWTCRRAEDVGLARPAHLHSAPAGDVVRIGHAVLPDRRDGGRDAASEGRDGRAQRSCARRGHGLRRLPAEHPRQDPGDRIQRARQRLRRRVDAAAWKEVDEEHRSARLHDRDGAEAVREGRGLVGQVEDGEAGQP